MNRLIVLLSLLMTALLLAAVSGETCQRMGAEPVLFEGVNPGFDTIHVVVGGWPLPYLEDNPASSPVGRVSVIGEDRFEAGPFIADTIFYLAALLGIWGTVRWLGRSSTALKNYSRQRRRPRNE